jgi:hypothetical protein
MKAIHVIAVLAAFCAVDFSAAEPEADVSIAVCRNGVTDAAQSPEKLTAAILKAVSHSQASSQTNAADDWDKIFVQPNWVHVQFSPATDLSLNTGRTAVSEILMVFPTGDIGRRWPDYILLKSDIGILSRARWSVCDMREIVSAAAFDPKDEAPPFNTYCASGR